MALEFCIPMSRDDLLTRTGINQYVVDEVYSLREVTIKIQEFQSAIRSKGALCILDCFDTIFSVLKLIHQVRPEIKEDAWKLMMKTLSMLSNQMVEFLEGDLEPHARQQYLTTLKMTCYLVCQLTEMFESESTKPSNVAPMGRGRPKKGLACTDLGTLDWEFEREKAVRGLLQLLQLNIHRLWDPPVVEEEFVNLVANCCYKLLENPAVSRNKSTRDTMFLLLGTMVKKYNHALSCSIKILTLLQHFEHLASPLSQAIEVFTKDFGNQTVIAEIMREIGRMDPKDLTRDSSGTKSYATFLVEVSEKIPAVMMSNITVILGLLDGESYSMRNCVLGILGEMILRVLSVEGLEEIRKTARDQFFDKLEDHIHDVNAFVRGKCLQIWLNIVNEKALPLPQQQSVLELTIGRLEDKSSQVRKYAIQLCTALLRSNPFAAKLPLEELKENYEKEAEKLKTMLPKEDDKQTKAREEAEQNWKNIEKLLQNAIRKIIQNDNTEDEEGENLQGDEKTEEQGSESDTIISDDDSIHSVKQKMMDLLKEGKYVEVAKLYLAGKEAFPQDPAFATQSVIEQMASGETAEIVENEESLDRVADTLGGIQAVYMEECLHKLIVQTVAGEAKAASHPTENETVITDLSKQQVLVQYLKDSMIFAGQIQRAVPIIAQLLGSKNNSDVFEAIEFFCTGFEFGVTNTLMGIRRMLVLVWSKEQAVKDTVVGAYQRLYLNPQGGNARAKALAVAANLTALTYGATTGDLTSLEQLICEFVQSGDLESKVIQVLWERFSRKIPNTTTAESRGALTLLGMAAGAEPNIVKGNIDVLVSEGLGERAENDFALAKEACLVLNKLGDASKSKPGEIKEASNRFPQDHEIFQRLSHLLVSGLGKVEKDHWVPMAEQALSVIYKLAEHPDAICGDIITKLVQASGYTSKPVAPEQPEPQPDEADHAAEGADKQEITVTEEISCSSMVLTRFSSFIGHVALRQLVHLDVALFGELKRRSAVQQTDGQKTVNTTTMVPPSASKRPNATTEDNKSTEPTLEEEMGMAGAAADDEEAEFIRGITEDHIVVGNNLLATVQSLLIAVCSNQGQYPDPELQAAASLALAKFMMVSSQFCESHLQLLFTVLEKSPHPTIRANTIIALGDLTFRFPNLIEPWTANLYARLRDTSPKVRKNTMMVLTHLILNDMVKVKGQISEMATCIVDEDVRISNLAKLFFQELAKKGNAVYNIMPDVISRLSDPEVGVEEDHFRIIMKYLFSFIQKDRMCEGLVEKLCHRFRATRVERQWRDLAFCLSLLSYSEKSIRKLQENFACFADKLAQEDVYESFQTIMAGTKKFAKPEIKALVEELEERLEKCHSKGVEDDEATQKANKASAAAGKKKGRKSKSPTKTPARRGRPAKGRTPAQNRNKKGRLSDEEDSDEDFHPAACRVNKQKPKLSFSSDEEEDSDLERFRPDKGASDEKNTNKISDAENADPNISDASPLLIVKKRHQSVNNLRPAGSSNEAVGARRSKRRGNSRLT